MTKLEMVNEMGLVDLVQNQRQKEQVIERCLKHPKSVIERAYNGYKNGTIQKNFILGVLTDFIVKD